MNTLPTEWRHVGHWSPFIDRGDDCGDECGAVVLVPLPDGLVLVREDCDTCGNDGTVIEGIGDPTFDTDARVPLWMLDERPCPACLGVPILAWYRVCDRCDNEHGGDGKGTACLGYHEPSEYGPEGYEWGPCPAGCVEVDGRRLVKVRRNQ